MGPLARTIAIALVSSLFGSIGAVSLDRYLHDRQCVQPAPFDSSFVAVGKGYARQLAQSYSQSWEEGAKALDSGQDVAAALKAVTDSWQSKRQDLFEKAVTPNLSKIVPEAKAAADLTATDRAALARAFRGLARGLGQ